MKPVQGCYLFGAYRACVGIKDAVILLHSVVGCNLGTLIYHMGNDLEDVRQAASVIYEDDVIGGGTSQLEKALRQMDRLYHQASLIIVISSCIPNMIGDDIEQAIENANINKQVLHICAPGMAGSDTAGYEAALLKLAQLITPQTQVKNHVNIIGMSMDDPRAESDIAELENILGSKLKVQTVFGFCNINDIKHSAKACLNIVFGKGLKLAQYMEKNFNIPYILADYPYGLTGTRALQEKLTAKLPDIDYADDYMHLKNQSIPHLKKITHYLQTLHGLPIAIIGSAGRSSGLKHFLENELGMDAVVCSNATEADLNDTYTRIENSNAVLLFGSSFERDLAGKMDIPLINFTYPVFDQIILGSKPFIGAEGMLNLLESIINSLLQHDHKKQGAFSGMKIK